MYQARKNWTYKCKGAKGVKGVKGGKGAKGAKGVKRSVDGGDFSALIS